MIGANAKIYRNTGTYGTPTWTEVPEFEQVNFDPAYAESSANSRASQFELVTPGLAGIGLTARLKVKPGNTNYEALMDAFALRSTVDLLVLNASKETVGARGFRAECYVLSAGDDQGLSTRLYHDLMLKPGDSDNSPKWAKVVTGPAVQYAVPGGSFA